MFTANMASNLKLSQFQIAWLLLKSPCVREHISIVVQLVFLVLLLLQFVRKLVSRISRNRTEARDQSVEKYMAGVKFNISYRITLVCSTLLLGTHLILLLIMLNGGETLCDSKVRAFSSEVMQVVLWASTLLTIYKIPSNKYAKFPWILRAWWFYSFSLYIICTALDTYSRVANHSQFKVRDYADFICLFPSTLLFGISIRGKTDLVYALSNDTTEPLINGKTDTPLEYKRESLYRKATLFQLVTFSWLNPLFAVGIKKPIDQNEIPDVDIKDSAEFLSHDFDERLKHVKQKDGSLNPSIYKAIFLFIKKKAAINALLAVISAECLMGMLKSKTVLYVTHQVEFLPAADLIVMMQNGKIAQVGRFDELLQQNIGFEVIVGAHNEALDSILKVENSSRSSQDLVPDGESSTDTTSNAKLIHSQHDSEHDLSLDITKKEGKLIQEEEREKGSIGKEVYWYYFTAVKGGALVPIIILAQSSFQVLQVASNYWMAWTSPTTIDAEPVVEMKVILLVYTLLAVGSAFCVLLRAMLVATTGLRTAQKLFTNMLHSIFRAPMAFFDSTPTGRILNRVSTDQSVLDLELAGKFGTCASTIIQIIGTIAVMSQAAWQVFVIFIPVTAICIWYQQYYIRTARELARLSEIQRAPILHHFAESLSGTATIHAFDQEDRFTNANLSLIDNHSRPWFHNASAMEWLSIRLNLLANFVFAFSLIVLVSLPEGTINPSIAGLAVTYGINLNVLQASIMWHICNIENKMISVERIIQYSNLKSEAPFVVEEYRPPNNWPEVGTICFNNLQIRYAEHLPSVLKNITCTFPGRKKIGVVGRTGSGKSTLIQAIFRIVEPREGSIIIDNVDICKIGLHDLRSRLSIIPQDPTLFEGTVRGNLDTLFQYSDKEVWEALDKCQLGDIVRAKEKRLDSPGQKIISQEFKDRTVVTIAHRIHTVIDSDFVLVLSDGKIAEYDSPKRLHEREDSFFSKLIKEYSMRSQNFNTTQQS
ncbi:hypothetical protein Ddye_018401 [Dipteronia dyeriana]|uniref:ABC-type xenobiotic transporter n=1 Tax=Dipteronia dyeriana TaxID=168575 RepID=A0AAD9X1W2_9ROSI|nr:hypothetical protein Ddye_018401 [Dipteronia dyeriana]